MEEVSPRVAKLTPREQLCKELLDTEKTHVALLKTLVAEYMLPLREVAGTEHQVLSSKQLADLFSNIELIQTWNAQFSKTLRKRLKKNLRGEFGDVLLHMVPMLRVLYTQYSENYAQAIHVYEGLKSNKAWMAFLGERRARLSRDFLTFLYLPIQRMMSYDSLLKDILALTPMSSDESRNLSRALRSLRAIISHAQERSLQRKNIDRVLAIQRSIVETPSLPALAVPHRRFVFESSATLLGGGASERHRERRLFLFNDMLVCVKPIKKVLAKPGRPCYEVDFVVSELHTLSVEDMMDSENPYFFVLRFGDSEVILSSPQKNAWMQLVEETLKQVAEAPHFELSEGTESAAVEVTREYLVSQVLRWSRMTDADAVLMEVADVAARLMPWQNDALI